MRDHHVAVPSRDQVHLPDHESLCCRYGHTAPSVPWSADGICGKRAFSAQIHPSTKVDTHVSHFLVYFKNCSQFQPLLPSVSKAVQRS